MWSATLNARMRLALVSTSKALVKAQGNYVITASASVVTLKRESMCDHRQKS